MRAAFGEKFRLHSALPLIVWAAIVGSPIRPLSKGQSAPNYLQGNLATCRVHRVRYVTQSDHLSGIRRPVGLAKGDPRPEWPRPEPSGFSPPPHDPSSPIHRRYPLSAPLTAPLRC
jgi:hypothetical protein